MCAIILHWIPPRRGVRCSYILQERSRKGKKASVSSFFSFFNSCGQICGLPRCWTFSGRPVRYQFWAPSQHRRISFVEDTWRLMWVKDGFKHARLNCSVTTCRTGWRVQRRPCLGPGQWGLRGERNPSKEGKWKFECSFNKSNTKQLGHFHWRSRIISRARGVTHNEHKMIPKLLEWKWKNTFYGT